MTDNKRKPGRPALDPGQRRDHTIQARLTADEAAKWAVLGGAAWLRQALKRAKP